jgi:hypothetical protein
MDKEIGKLKFVMHNGNYHRPINFPLYITNTGVYSGRFRLKLPIKQLTKEIRDVYGKDAYFLHFLRLVSLSFNWGIHDLIRNILNNRKGIQDVEFSLGTNTSKNIYSSGSNELENISNWLSKFSEQKTTYIYRITNENFSKIDTIGSIELKIEGFNEQNFVNIVTPMVL